MKYCTNCGTQINDLNAKFCPMCATPVNAKTSAKSKSIELPLPKVKLPNKKMSLIVIATIIVVSVIILGKILFSGNTSEPTLANSEKLLGTSCEKIINNDKFDVRYTYGIAIAKAETKDVFGISGENVIFILSDDQKYIDIVTWQSEDDVELTEKEIDKFLNGMKKVYGKYLDSSEEGSYTWDKKDFVVMLELDNDGAYISWIMGD